VGYQSVKLNMSHRHNSPTFIRVLSQQRIAFAKGVADG